MASREYVILGLTRIMLHARWCTLAACLFFIRLDADCCMSITAARQKPETNMSTLKLTPLLAALTLAAAAPALAGTVTVITSFPKELTQAYKTAFEKAHPDIKLEILNKNTVSGI